MFLDQQIGVYLISRQRDKHEASSEMDPRHQDGFAIRAQNINEVN